MIHLTVPHMKKGAPDSGAPFDLQSAKTLVGPGIFTFR
mgnify:CR=1 FL=1